MIDTKDVVIIGSGPAGWTAAIYAVRADLNSVVIEGNEPGGQLMLTTEVENFPGFSKGIQGTDLMQEMRNQAKRLGVKIITAKVDSLKKKKQFEIKCGDKIIKAKSVIISSGASARWLNIPSEEKFKGRGLSACATCDGFFFKEKNVIVVGGGDAAMEEAQFLARICKSVVIVHRRDCLRASEAMQNKIEKFDNIKFIWNSEIKEFKGENMLNSVILHNLKTNKDEEMKIDGVFLAIGHTPNVSFIEKGLVNLEKGNFIHTNNTKTKTRGLFAAGDVQDNKYKQAITAAASGCIAALEAKDYLSKSYEHKTKDGAFKKNC